MNIELFNALKQAYNFFIVDEKICAKIKQYEAAIRRQKGLYSLYLPDPPAPVRSKVKWGNCIIFLIFCFPIGIVLLLYNLCVLWFESSKEEKAKRKYEAEREKIINSPKYIEHCKEVSFSINRVKNLLQAANIERETHYQKNYQKYLGFIPENYRRKDLISKMLLYVENGNAITLQMAMHLVARDLAEEARDEEELEARREANERYNRMQRTIANIEEDNKRILEELERRRYRGY